MCLANSWRRQLYPFLNSIREFKSSFRGLLSLSRIIEKGFTCSLICWRTSSRCFTICLRIKSATTQAAIIFSKYFGSDISAKLIHNFMGVSFPPWLSRPSENLFIRWAIAKRSSPFSTWRFAAACCATEGDNCKNDVKVLRKRTQKRTYLFVLSTWY